MLYQLDSQEPIVVGRITGSIKPFPGVISLNGAFAASAILLSVILTVISLLFINGSVGEPFLGLHPSGQAVSSLLHTESIACGSSANVPAQAYYSPSCGPDLSSSFKSADRHDVAGGETLTYTIVLINTGDCDVVRVSDTIPISTSYKSGSARVNPPGRDINDAADHIEWTGTVQNGTPIRITFPVTVSPEVEDGETILNAAWISYGDTIISRTVSVTVDADGPNLWGCYPSGWVTSTRTPTCTVQVRDLVSGMDVSSAVYRYSSNGGVSWNGPWLPAGCSGVAGTTLTQTCAAKNVLFEQDSEAMNRIEFRVSDMAGYAACRTCTIPIDTVPPTFGSLAPQDLVTTTRTPTCTARVSDVISGLNVVSASYQYSKDGGISWNGKWLPAECSGVSGITDSQLITATAVLFSQNGSTRNLIRFRVSDVAGNVATSVMHSVSISVPYTMYLPFVAKNYTHPLFNGDFEIVDGGFALYWKRQGDLSVSVTSTLSNGDPCYSGTYCTLLGDPAYPCEGVPLGYGRVHQTFGVPLKGTPTLSFHYRIFSYDDLKGAEGDKFDSFDVYVDDIFDPGPPILILRDGSRDGVFGCNEDDLEITDWRKFPEDGAPEFYLSAIPDGNGGTVDYRGKTIRLSFYIYTRELPGYLVSWYNTWVYVDDVRIGPVPPPR